MTPPRNIGGSALSALVYENVVVRSGGKYALWLLSAYGRPVLFLSESAGVERTDNVRSFELSR